MRDTQGIYIPKRIYSIISKEGPHALPSNDALRIFGEEVPSSQRIKYSLSTFFVPSATKQLEQDEKLRARINKRKISGENKVHIFDNKPDDSWRLIRTVDQKNAAYVVNDDLFIFAIPLQNLNYILRKKGVTPDDGVFPKLNGEFVIGTINGRVGDYLIPLDTNFYKKSKAYTKGMMNPESLRSVKPGSIVHSAHADVPVQYMGGWYLCVLTTGNIISYGQCRFNHNKNAEANVDLLHPRRRYISLDKKDLFTDEFKYATNLHSKFKVFDIENDDDTYDYDEAREKVIDAFSRTFADKNDNIKNVWDTLPSLFEINYEYGHGNGERSVLKSHTIAVENVFRTKPEKWPLKFHLEKKSEDEKNDVIDKIINSKYSSKNFYLFHDKESDLYFFNALMRGTKYGNFKVPLIKCEKISDIVAKKDFGKDKVYFEQHNDFLPLRFNDTIWELDKLDDDFKISRKPRSGISLEHPAVGIFKPIVTKKTERNPNARRKRDQEVDHYKFFTYSRFSLYQNINKFDLYELKTEIDGELHSLRY